MEHLEEDIQGIERDFSDLFEWFNELLEMETINENEVRELFDNGMSNYYTMFFDDPYSDEDSEEEEDIWFPRATPREDPPPLYEDSLEGLPDYDTATSTPPPYSLL
jgi:hypothetical protein